MDFMRELSDELDIDRMQNALLEALTDGVYFVDRHRRILYWNRAAERISGYTSREVLGTCCAGGVLVHVDANGKCLCSKGCPLSTVMRDGRPHDMHAFLHHKRGHRVPVHIRAAALQNPSGQTLGSVEVFSDDSDRVQTLDRLRELEETALIDELTGLANRRYYDRAISANLTAFEREQTPFGVLLMDIDHFKRFNDTYGHETGDRVLRLVGRTLSCNCRAHDTPVRWGGEEFAIVCERVAADDLLPAAERIRALVASSFIEVKGERVAVTVSIGGCMVQPGDDARSILERADERLYRSKTTGRNRVTLDPAATSHEQNVCSSAVPLGVLSA